MFVKDRFHWLDLSGLSIDFAHQQARFGSTAKEWSLDVSVSQQHFSGMSFGSEHLIDSTSRTASTMHQLLSGLDHPQNIVVKYDIKSKRIRVDLPRYKLAFEVVKDRVESLNFPGMVVDKDQSCGTLIGLRQQLVLCHRSSLPFPISRSRRVIIPVAKVSAGQIRDHQSVNIEVRDNGDRVRFHSYELDNDLGRLIGSGGCESHFYKIHLHSLTSSYLPDPLTGHTGTETALCDLRSAGSRSFQSLQSAEITLLSAIGGLSSSRSYYPDHLRSMQKIEWRTEIHGYLQHPQYAHATREILEYAQVLEVFCDSPSPELSRELDRRTDQDLELLLRARKQISHIYPACAQVEHLSAIHRYPSRDLATDMLGSVSKVSRAAIRTLGSTGTYWLGSPEESLNAMFVSWNLIAGPKASSLGYMPNDGPVSQHMRSEWLSVYDQCRSRAQDKKKSSQLAFTLPMMQEADPSKIESIIPYLVAFRNTEAFENLAPPVHLSFDLQYGRKPSRERIQSLVQTCSLDLFATPSSYLIQANDDDDDYIRRQGDHYGINLTKTADEAVSFIVAQWPSTDITLPSDPYHNYNLIEQEINDLFAHWTRNGDLLDHLADVQSAVNSLSRRFRNLQPLSPATFSFEPQYERIHSEKPSEPRALVRLMSTREPPSTDTISSLSQARQLAASIGSISCSEAPDTQSLQTLIFPFLNATQDLSKRYGEALDRSRKLLEKSPDQHGELPTWADKERLGEMLADNLVAWNSVQAELLERISNALAPASLSNVHTENAKLRPRISWGTVFQQLSHLNRPALPASWRRCLAEYGTFFMMYQRALTLYLLQSAGRSAELFKEMTSPLLGAEPWDKNPDWLLVQVSHIR